MKPDDLFDYGEGPEPLRERHRQFLLQWEAPVKTSVLMHEKTVCPFCGEAHPLAAHTPGNTDRPPENGDLSFCFDCGEWAVFDNRLKGGCRKPTYGEYAEIVSNPLLARMRGLWLDVKGRGSDGE